MALTFGHIDGYPEGSEFELRRNTWPIIGGCLGLSRRMKPTAATGRLRYSSQFGDRHLLGTRKKHI